MLNRRELLGAAAAAAATGWSGRGLGQGTMGETSIVRLTDRLAVLAGVGANVTILTAPEGALLVDGGAPQATGRLLAAVAELAGRADVPILFNTNWRPEHTGANDMLGAAGTTIIAHENTRLWMGADFDVPWEGRDHDPRPPEALPNRTFYTADRLLHDGEPVEYGHLAQAHTDGDIFVLFPNANVLVVSDLLAVDGYPILDYVTGGWIGGMEDATRTLLDMTDSQTRIVPAVGAVQARNALAAQLELCTTTREAVGIAYRSGHSLQEFVAARPVREFEAERGDPATFLELVYRGAWGHVRELSGII